MTAKTYAGKDIVITYDASRCIHAAECVRGAPLAFDPTAKPWIQPDNADAATLAAVVQRCPTGALTALRTDGTALEVPDANNSAALQPNGPIYLRGRISASVGAHATLVEYTRAAICRCGASNNKPFCDGSHTKIGFTDSGCCAKMPTSANAAPTGPVRLNPIPNGPLMVEGRIEFRAADSTMFVTEEKTWLCRCGHSANKPFCDGTHKKIGFTA
jgi:CDGSH-type Zn-finger protein/uncharacterized Fe-S cluster protein YjdI